MYCHSYRLSYSWTYSFSEKLLKLEGKYTVHCYAVTGTSKYALILKPKPILEI